MRQKANKRAGEETNETLERRENSRRRMARKRAGEAENTSLEGRKKNKNRMKTKRMTEALTIERRMKDKQAKRNCLPENKYLGRNAK